MPQILKQLEEGVGTSNVRNYLRSSGLRRLAIEMVTAFAALHQAGGGPPQVSQFYG